MFAVPQMVKFAMSQNFHTFAAGFTLVELTTWSGP
jgi:hypothetical protein